MSESQSMKGTEAQPEWRLPSVPKVGMISLIVMETALFTIFVVAYLFYIGKSLNGPFPAEVLEVPIIGSICLFSSSLTVILAEKAFRRQQMTRFRFFWGLTWLLGAAFIAFTGLEWKDLIVNHGLKINTNLFGSTYYPLVGLHATHVVIGLLLLGIVWILSLRNHLGPRHLIPVEMVSWYWHFVDAIWVVVFTVVYLI